MERDIVEALMAAIGQKRLVRLSYNGGSHPGQSREVIPVVLDEDRLIVADPSAGIRKIYRLDRIAWIEDELGRRLTNSSAAPLVPQPDVPEFCSIGQYVALYEEEFRKIGWHTEATETSFSVGTYFKNGKPKKTPSIAIQFYPSDDTAHAGPVADDGSFVQGPPTSRTRPWRVDSWRFHQGRTFAELSRAMALFIAEVRESSPSLAKGMFSGH